MAQITPKVGIDCSEGRLDVHIYPLEIAFSVANDPDGWADLDRRLKEAQADIVGVESSGGCERDLSRFLMAHGYSVRQVSPYRVRQFAKALGKLAKTDRIDAQTIALFVTNVATRPKVRHKHLEALAEMVTARTQLLEQLTVARNQARRRETGILKEIDARRAKALQDDIKLLNRHIAEAIRADAALSAKSRIIGSMKGAGPVLIQTILAFLPELGQLTRKQIAALVGVAPMDDQSGKRKGLSFIQGGRLTVRNALYMAALVAGRHHPLFKAFRDKLGAAGKKPKVALVAVMRKIITTLNAMIRDGRSWVTPEAAGAEPVAASLACPVT